MPAPPACWRWTTSPDSATLDVTSDTLLAAAAARANITESATALPAGRSLYGYWVNGSLLNSLLGDGAAEALQNANWDEWSDFVETLQNWLAEPKAATVTLNGADCTLPEARPEALTATGVFAPPLDRTSGYTVAVLAGGRPVYGRRPDRPAERHLQRRLAGMGRHGRQRRGRVVPPGQADRPAGRLRGRRLPGFGFDSLQNQPWRTAI